MSTRYTYKIGKACANQNETITRSGNGRESAAVSLSNPDLAERQSLAVQDGQGSNNGDDQE